MTDDTLLPFDLPVVRRKKLGVEFNGSNQSSNGGLLPLRHSERQFVVCEPHTARAVRIVMARD
jgi:hypothetical protein